MLSVEEARSARLCRICEQAIGVDTSVLPAGWEHAFGRMALPVGIALDFGEEFAHTNCVRRQCEVAP